MINEEIAKIIHDYIQRDIGCDYDIFNSPPPPIPIRPVKVKSLKERLEETKMEPTSIWEIEDIDKIWITQDGNEISLLLKNRDDLTKIILTGDAIKNHNDNFVTTLKVDLEEEGKKFRELETELGRWKKEAADCLRLRDEVIREKNKEINKLKQQLQQAENDKRKYEWKIEEYNKNFEKWAKKCVCGQREQENETKCENCLAGASYEEMYRNLRDKLEKENENLKKELHSLKTLKKSNLPETPIIENFADEKPVDNVNHPSHYTGRYECIDVMQDVFGDEATNDFCLCNAFKYIWRARKKNGLEDVKKAVWYLNKYIEEAEKDGEDKVTGTRTRLG